VPGTPAAAFWTMSVGRNEATATASAGACGAGAAIVDAGDEGAAGESFLAHAAAAATAAAITNRRVDTVGRSYRTAAEFQREIQPV